MAVRILVRGPGGTDAETGASAVHRFSTLQVAVGSSPDCDLVLSGLPPTAVTIESRGTELTIRRDDSDLTLQVEDTPVTEAAPCHYGDRIQVGDYCLALGPAVRDCQQRRGLQLMSRMTVVLIVAIFVLEVGVIGWLPRKIESRRLWGVELARQRAKGLLDGSRRKLHQWPDGAPDDQVTRSLRVVLGAELDRCAFYLRDYIDRLDQRELVQIEDDLGALADYIDRLADGELLPEPPQLAVDTALRSLLSEEGEDEDRPPQ